MISWKSALLNIRALLSITYLAVRAQRIRRHSLQSTLEVLPRISVSKQLSTEQLVRWSIGVSRRMGRMFGTLDTCIVHSLIVAHLVGDRGVVHIHVGFRAAGGVAPAEGHAWVTLDGEAITAPNDQPDKTPYTPVQSLEIL